MKQFCSVLLILLVSIVPYGDTVLAKKVAPTLTVSAELIEQENTGILEKGKSEALRIRFKNTGTFSLHTWSQWVLNKDRPEPLVLIKDGADTGRDQVITQGEVGTFIFTYTPLEIGEKTLILAPYLFSEKKTLSFNREVSWKFSVQDKNNTSVVESKLDITDYTNTVGLFVCLRDGKTILGSGTLYEMPTTRFTGSRYNILTNNHVLEGTSSCTFYLEKQKNNTYPILEFPTISYIRNTERDAALVPILSTEFDYQELKIRSWNWGISQLAQCSAREKVGRNIFTIGYPASSETSQYYKDEEGNKKIFIASNQIVTNGIVSGYAYVSADDKSPDYFVSNNIDHGNSGGIALAEKNNSYCILGIPSWISQGISANLGIVLNIQSLGLAKSKVKSQ